MNNKILSFSIYFVVLVLLQVLVLNRMELGRWVSPFIYPLFVLLLPFEVPRWLVLLLSFAIGLSVDVFSNTLGIHAAATVLVGYARYGITALLRPQADYQPTDLPTLGIMGFRWFATYAALCIVVHHLACFSLEFFSFHYIGDIFLKTIFSATLSMAMILLWEYFFYTKP